MIHPTAILSPQAQIGVHVNIGPYCIIGPDVQLGDRVSIHSHVVIEGNTTIGEDTQIFPFCSLGTTPQHQTESDPEMSLVIGQRNILREYVTMQPGKATIVGDDGLFMIGTHIAHDCVIGNHCVLANHATLAGHVVLGHHVRVGGLAAIHQYVHIGDYAMIGGMSGVASDVIPYGMVYGDRASLRGINIIGLKRSGMSHDTIQSILHLYDEIFMACPSTMRSQRVKELREQYDQTPEALCLIDFILFSVSRGLCMPKAM